MNAYKRTNTIGAIGVSKALELFRIRHIHDGQLVTTSKGRLSLKFQKTVGDFLFNRKGDPERLFAVEVKTEEKFTGNLFLEYWSNRRRMTPGWMFTCKADVLCYVFLDTLQLFTLRLPQLQHWAFNRETKYKNFPGHAYLYPLVRQKKQKQLNDTWGRLVPIADLPQDVGLTEWDLRTQERIAPAVAEPRQARLFALESR